MDLEFEQSLGDTVRSYLSFFNVHILTYITYTEVFLDEVNCPEGSEWGRDKQGGYAPVTTGTALLEVERGFVLFYFVHTIMF